MTSLPDAPDQTRDVRRGRPARAAGGFTLVEAVFTIVIMAILAALALPRYLDFQKAARAAKAQAAFGSVRSAAALAKAQCLVDQSQGVANQCATSAGTLILEGESIATSYAYPAASSIALAAGLDATDYQISVAGSDARIDVPGATAASGCRVTYTPPASASGAPTVTVQVTQC